MTLSVALVLGATLGCSGSDAPSTGSAPEPALTANAGAGGGNNPQAAKPNNSAGAPNDSDWCPAVIYFSTANIQADLPVTIEQAITGSFKACRKNDCLEAKLDAASAWSVSDLLTSVSLKATSGTGGNSVELIWTHHAEANDFTAPDQYELTFSADPASAPLTVFDTEVSYVKVPDTAPYYTPHPELCGASGKVEVDLRAESK
jgi:hypothetical protein